MKNKILLSAGGTGGHLFPAQALGSKLKKNHDVLFVGGGLATNRYFDRTHFAFQEIQTSSLPFKHPLKLIRALKRIVVGFIQSRKILSTWRPSVVVGFGSFYTFPLLLAAWSLKIPIVLHEQNSIPGKVNRLFSKKARLTAITFPGSERYLKGPSVQVAFPLRFPRVKREKEESLAYFGLQKHLQTLLVFGGSQGGQGINRLMLEMAAVLSKDFQVLHFTGNAETTRHAKDLYSKLGIAFVLKEFEPQMDHAWNVADLAFCRAGASTVIEAIEWEVPSIFIPFPFASERHQDYNAAFFVKQVKGGWMFLEDNAKGHEIAEVISQADLASLRKNLATYNKEKTHKLLEELL